MTLDTVATTSRNIELQVAHGAYLSLTSEQRLSLLHSIIVIDGAPTIDDLVERLAREVHWVVGNEKMTGFLERLEGWWFRRVVESLRTKPRQPIPSWELESKMRELREQFREDALPIDDDIANTYVDADDFSDYVFIRQLGLINIGSHRLLAAARAYYRAFEQRSRWMREDLLLVGELEKYERRLREEWEIVYGRVVEELGSGASESEKVGAGRQLYQIIENAVLPIRPAVTEPFVTRGSYHIMADRLAVGWHPDFITRLSHLLSLQGTEP
jgi:hypothetical protein